MDKLDDFTIKHHARLGVPPLMIIGAEPLFFKFSNFTKYHDRIGINTSLSVIVGSL